MNNRRYSDWQNEETDGKAYLKARSGNPIRASIFAVGVFLLVVLVIGLLGALPPVPYSPPVYESNTIRTLQTQETALLNGYGWIVQDQSGTNLIPFGTNNQETGIVHIPISEAMTKILEPERNLLPVEMIGENEVETKRDDQREQAHNLEQ
ncbi:MAG: hypothetical protein HC837_00360 [Chloroflexaceae bacterium]|nr:hypothetical protein [Chloroflexaceae bacterium]